MEMGFYIASSSPFASPFPIHIWHQNYSYYKMLGAPQSLVCLSQMVVKNNITQCLN